MYDVGDTRPDLSKVGNRVLFMYDVLRLFLEQL